jgi:hypothetical protein
MADVRELLNEAIGSYAPLADQRAVERRVERRHRNQRISSAVVALSLIGAVAWLGWATLRPGASTPGSTPSPLPTAPPVVVPDVSDGPAPDEPIPLEGLPRAGVAVSSEGAVQLVDLQGRVVVELPGFAIVGNPGAPGVWLERDGSFYVLSDVLDRLVPVTEEEADDRAFDEGPEPTLPPPPGEPDGHWRYTIERVPAAVLAQWSGDCEVPVAHWIEGGDSEVVTGGVDPSTAPSSLALGWSPDGEAIVQVSEGACGGTTDDPGIYRFGAPGSGRLVYAIPDGEVVADSWGAGL